MQHLRKAVVKWYRIKLLHLSAPGGKLYLHPIPAYEGLRLQEPNDGVPLICPIICSIVHQSLLIKRFPDFFYPSLSSLKPTASSFIHCGYGEHLLLSLCSSPSVFETLLGSPDSFVDLSFSLLLHRNCSLLFLSPGTCLCVATPIDIFPVRKQKCYW